MTITYTVTTHMLVNARDSALRRAEAEGWRNIQVLQTRQVGPQTYEIDVLVSR